MLSGPVSYTQEKKIEKNGIDIQIVLDLSYSMVAEDLSPNRLEVAKGVLTSFVESRETDRIGLVLFSGKPFTSIPLTFDYRFIREYVEDISIDIIDRSLPNLGGTAIGDGLLLGYESLFADKIEGDELSKDNREKIIILITDGEANAGIDPITALKVLKDADIKVYTIGVGGLDDTYVDYVDPFGFRSRLAIGGIDEDTLKKISGETGGIYYRATSSEVMEEIFVAISELEKTDIEQNVVQVREDKQDVFLYMLTFLFLCLLGLISYKHIPIS